MTIAEKTFNEAKANFTEAYENFITGKVEFVDLIESLKERSEAYEVYREEKAVRLHDSLVKMLL